MNPIIRFENVSYSYPGDEQEKGLYAVKNLSFDINEGEFVAVLGHNGSGKSTCAKLMNMILAPNDGKIFIDGKDITHLMRYIAGEIPDLSGNVYHRLYQRHGNHSRDS